MSREHLLTGSMSTAPMFKCDKCKDNFLFRHMVKLKVRKQKDKTFCLKCFKKEK